MPARPADTSARSWPRRAGRSSSWSGRSARPPCGSGGCAWSAPPERAAGRAAGAAGPAGYADTGLFTVKAVALGAAIDEVRPAVGPDTTIVPVLNGLRHLDTLNAASGNTRVLGGVAVSSKGASRGLPSRMRISGDRAG